MSTSLIDTLRQSIQEERQAEQAESEALIGTLSAKSLERAGLVRRTDAGVVHSALILHRRLDDFKQIRAGHDVLSHLATLVRVQKQALVLSVDEWTETPRILCVVKTYSDVSYRRSLRCLDNLATLPNRSVQRLYSVLIGDQRVQSLGPERRLTSSSLRTLNPGQRQVVHDALRSENVFVIHGPPGCGKTTTVAHLIAEATRSGLKVLVCAPSNIAVDCVVERLSQFKLKMVRLGHPARILPSVLDYCLDEMISRSEAYRLASDVRTELRSLQKPAGKSRAKPDQRQQVRKERRQLATDLRKLEKRMTQEILAHVQVICSTCIGADVDLIRDVVFDVCVIDEAGQGLESECWIPAAKAKKLVLAGDHHQLAPTTKSEFAHNLPTMFERMHAVLSAASPAHIGTLTTQYRMNAQIQNWSSSKFYKDALTPAQSVRDHVLADLPHVASTSDTRNPLVFIDTSFCDYDEEEPDPSDALHQMSRGNRAEARVAALHALRLLKAGVRPDQIAILTPYHRQVDLCRNALQEHRGDRDCSGLEVGTVDGFQGREKEAITISCVRSNSNQEIGFLSDHRRMNVAVTRARRHLCVVADSHTLGSDPHLAGLVQYLQEHALYRSAALYDDPDVDFEDDE